MRHPGSCELLSTINGANNTFTIYYCLPYRKYLAKGTAYA